MESDSTSTLTPQQLLQLLNLDHAVRWDERDAAAALQHQLHARLLPDLASVPLALAEAGLQESQNPGQSDTFQGHLTSPRPRLEILKAIKLFAKHFRDDPLSPLRQGPATVLYFAAIAAAMVRHGIHITQLSDSELRQGCDWAKSQKGAEGLHSLFEEAIAKLCQ